MEKNNNCGTVRALSQKHPQKYKGQSAVYGVFGVKKFKNSSNNKRRCSKWQRKAEAAE